MCMCTNNKHKKLPQYLDYMFVPFSISSKKEKQCLLYIYFIKNY